MRGRTLGASLVSALAAALGVVCILTPLLLRLPDLAFIENVL
jgi:hypothetical protein